MRQKFLVFTLLLVLVMLCPKGDVLYAQTDSKTDGIYIAGEAKVWIEPDRARVYLGIETMDINVDVARDTNAVKIKAVIDALNALKIEGALIKAPSYNVSLVKEHEHDATIQGRLPKIIGYKLEQYFTVLLQNKDALVLGRNASRVIDTALSNGVNIIQQVEFFKEDDSADKREALKLALKNAMENAKVLAETAGVSIKAYRMISSFTNYWTPTYFHVQSQMTQVASFESVGGGTPTTLAAGRIAVNANVQIRCEIQ